MVAEQVMSIIPERKRKDSMYAAVAVLSSLLSHHSRRYQVAVIRSNACSVITIITMSKITHPHHDHGRRRHPMPSPSFKLQTSRKVYD